MGKWYKQGYNDAKKGYRADPPYEPGNKHFAAYMEGFEDREKENDLYPERDAEAWNSAAQIDEIAAHA